MKVNNLKLMLSALLAMPMMAIENTINPESPNLSYGYKSSTFGKSYYKSRSKYMPHQGKKECARRLKQKLNTAL